MNSTQVSIHADARAFLAAAGSMLYARETVNNLILGVSERLAHDPTAYENPLFATVSSDEGEICLAAVMTPPHNLILAGDALDENCLTTLISHLKAEPIDIPGVIAQDQMAERFTKVWTQQTGDTCELSMRMRVYELRQVRGIDPPRGHFQKANPLDIPTIAKWVQAFEAEALGEMHEINVPRAERLVDGGQIFTWVVDGQVVSMAMKTRPIAHAITVGEVYTPPEHRRQGYAGALVANLSQYLLDEGYQFVNLFTDLNNPTSNKIYQAVGYHPICDFLTYRINQAVR
ncbi:MAG: GNAT family N-acetyltransferase [Brevefilum sp.]